MNGIIKSTITAVCVASGLAVGAGRLSAEPDNGNCGPGGCGTPMGCGAGGCGTQGSKCQSCYYRWVDPCWPDRYNAMARFTTNCMFATQVNNGHVLDQTMWMEHFVPGTDQLTVGGMYKLSILARRRPQPDCKIFLQTAQDVTYDPAAPEKLALNRGDLNARRVQAILRYLQAETADRPVAWEVTIHDPTEVGMSAVPMQSSILQRNMNFRGILPSTFGAGGGAGTPGAAGVGGGIGGGVGGGLGGGVGGNAGGLGGRTGLGY